MTEDIKQQLSALLDGELDSDTRRFLLRRLQREEELAGCWERWHLARDCMQQQRVSPLRPDFAARIAAALQSEAQPAARGAGATILRWGGGLAVAASVALAALLVMPGPGSVPGTADALPAIAVQPADASQVVSSGLSERDLRPNLSPVARTVAVTDGQSLGPALRLDPRVESYLMRHNAVMMQSGQDSFVPFIHVVSPPRQWSMLPTADHLGAEPARAEPDRAN
jgi:sigma-E factor negative regulatory protein RseA